MLKFKQSVLPTKSASLAGSLPVYVDTGEALEFIKSEASKDITLTTMIAWIKQYHLGRKIGGRWQVDKTALNNFIHGGDRGRTS